MYYTKRTNDGKTKVETELTASILRETMSGHTKTKTVLRERLYLIRQYKTWVIIFRVKVILVVTASVVVGIVSLFSNLQKSRSPQVPLPKQLGVNNNNNKQDF